MVRRKRTELIETIERAREIYTPLGWTFQEQKSMFTAPDGARLRFAYLERDADAESYQGHSYTRVYVEEIGNFPSPKPILKLMATLRSGAGVPVGFRATGNPGGPGHNWVRARYIDPAPRGFKLLQDSTSGLERIFIPSKLGDNRYLGQDYVQRLKAAGSEQLVKAWLDGDWNAIEGAFFHEWSNAKHVIDPFPIPDDWLRFRSMDWGSASPFSVGWWAVASDPRGPIQRGALVRYREWYGAKDSGDGAKAGLKLTAEEVAHGIIRKSANEHIKYTVLDPSAFKQDGGPSIAERMAKAGVHGLRPADNARVSRVGGAIGGWDMMRYRIKGVDGVPMIYCFHTCVDSIRTIPVLQHDPDKPEDLDTESEDHAGDEWRYACMSRPWLPRQTPVIEEKSHHVLEVDAFGRVRSNLSVREAVNLMIKRKRRA